MAWSPDFEIVAFVTSANTLLMMTQDWDPILEQPLIPNHAELFAQTKFDSAAARISWRGDGQFFVVSSKENGVTVFRTYDRSGKLHSRSEDISKAGLVQSSVVSWKPSGELIASSARHQTSGKHEIIFFERNGLRHGEFALRDADVVVEDILWNSTSDLLALLLKGPTHHIVQLWYAKNYHWYLKHQEDFVGKKVIGIEWDQEKPYVVTLACASGEVSVLEFALHVDISRGNNPWNKSVVAVIDGSQIGLTPTEFAVPPPPFSSAQISVAPDRVSSLDFSADFGAIAVKHSSNTISVFEPYSPIVESGKPPVFSVGPKLRFSFPLDASVGGIRLLQFLSDSQLVGIVSRVEQDEIVGLSVVDGAASVAFRVRACKSPARVINFFQNKDTLSVFVELDSGQVSQLFVGNNFGSGRLAHVAQLPVACPWISSAVFGGIQPHGDLAESNEHIIALSERSKLYIQHVGSLESNPVVVSQECNSFAVQGGEFVLFTTVSHTLRVMSLHRTVEENMEILAAAASRTKTGAPQSTSKGGGTSASGGNWNDSIREVEQGGILISVVANQGTRVILQMPRGNLETIEPRALVVSGVRRALSKSDYKSAFLSARKHRLDLNIIYDHDPTLFMSNLDKFVKQVADVDYLNLFISSLSKEDVTKTIFVDLWRDPKAKLPQELVIKDKLRSLKLGKAPPATENKIRHVCDALRAVFQKVDANKYLLPILTTYVLRDPPQTEEALRLIQRLRQQERELGLVGLDSAGGHTAEKALKYLIFLVDVNVLYNIALGMYDLDLVLAVAQKSQKDPREYLPFLADLQKQEKFVQQFNIDMHLKRYEKALESIAQAEPQETYFSQNVVPLLAERGQYPKAIEIYYNNPDKSYLVRLYDLYAKHLMQERHYGQAAMCWRAAGKPQYLPLAMEAYKKHGDWRGAVSCAYELHLDAAARQQMGQDLAASLLMQYRFEDAALVYETFLGDVDSALSALVQGSLWEQAVLLCSRHGKHDRELEQLVKPAVVEAADTLTRDLGELIVKFTKYHNRLVVVRANKHIQAQQLPNAPTPAEIEGSETGSIYSAGSGSGSESESAGDDAASRRSGATRGRGGGRGGRGGKKKPRPPGNDQPVGKKKLSGRKGSPHEEEYLVTEMIAMLPNSKLQDDVRYLLRHLTIFGVRDKAVQLQKRLGEWLDAATKALPLLSTLSPKTREESEVEEHYLRTRDALLDAVVRPVNLAIVASTLVVPRTNWELDLLK